MTFSKVKKVVPLILAGAMISIVQSGQAASRSTSITYNTEGLIETVNGPRTDVGDITLYEYDLQGNLVKTTNALGQESTITAYNDHGQPLIMIDPNGTVTSLTYDLRRRLTNRIVDGQTTSFLYDDVGNIIRTTLPNGAYLENTYDAAHRLIKVEDNLGNTISYTLNVMGNRIQEDVRDLNDILRQTMSRTYNDLNRLVGIIGGAGQETSMSYDLEGNQTQTVLDPAGLNQPTSFLFDALNRMATVTDAGNGITAYIYDGRDNLTSVTDPEGNTTTYTYDGLDNLIQQDSPDTGITSFSHDDAGNVTSQTDARGVVTQYTYDALNRLTGVHYPGSPGEDITYQYDQPTGGFGIGQLTSRTDQSGTTSWMYDRRGNVVAETVTIQGNAYTTEYAYDSADVLVQTVYPSGRIVDHQLDMLGRTAAVTTMAEAGQPVQDVADNITYLPFGPMNAFRQGNGLDTAMSYDQDYRLAGIAVTDGSGGGNPAVLDLSYSFDAANNIQGIVDALNASRTQNFTYDLLNRLTGAGGVYGAQGFGYDKVGNRVSATLTRDGNTIVQNYSYAPDSNRLSSIDDGTTIRAFQYDAAGNVTTDDRGGEEGRTLEYNDQNRLIEVAPGGAP